MALPRYEHAYHDWTQFAEVYDTTLDIDLAPDGRTWVDDFAVKGPSPAKAPRSWRGSPVANGAHYPLYGTLDPSKPGELEETGFGEQDVELTYAKVEGTTCGSSAG